MKGHRSRSSCLGRLWSVEPMGAWEETRGAHDVAACLANVEEASSIIGTRLRELEDDRGRVQKGAPECIMEVRTRCMFAT